MILSRALASLVGLGVSSGQAHIDWDPPSGHAEVAVIFWGQFSIVLGMASWGSEIQWILRIGVVRE